MSNFLIGYIVASLFIAVLDSLLAIVSFRKGGVQGKALGATCVGCAFVDLSYLVSVLVDDYFVYSCLSSVYFVCIDIMLLCLVMFIRDFCKFRNSAVGRGHFMAAHFIILVDIIVFAINPFCEIAISYVPRATEFAKYSYNMHGLFYVHLFFCYAMVATCVYFLLYKLVSVPLEYKRQFLYAVAGVVSIVAINAVFLFLPGLSKYNFLDYSILGYSIGAYAFYWACFQYSIKGMTNLFKMSVFENIDQGLMLFDYENRLILYNDMVYKQFPRLKFRDMLPLREFTDMCGVNIKDNYENYVVQCYAETDAGKKPLRCDFRTLRNKRGRIIGRLFMFSNAVLATDPLTGFHNWDDFVFCSEENKDVARGDLVVLACDIMGLSFINGSKGRHAGDRCIKELADLMRNYFPDDAYFVRGQDAILIAFCAGGSEEIVVDSLKALEEKFEPKIQYGVSVCRSSDNMLEGIGLAIKGLKQKKLLCKESNHSVILNSLVQALQESDNDTEEHVRRTQLMGAELGRRIGLNDVQLSDLSLLCLLHDIGKIGVPLEILNKPGKLTAEEWDTLRTHPVKGYQIAQSSPELCGIADMILHHHERWDGAGYPDGLARESIPLLSRIIAVVDAFDAMVNTRAYRKALPQDVAIEELKRCAGTQFDPNIVSEFIQMIEALPSKASEVAEAVSEEVREVVRDELTQGASSANSFHSVHNLRYVRYTLDEQNNIIDFDKDFERLTGFNALDIQKNRMNQTDLLPPEDRTEYVCQITEALGKNPSAFFEHRIMRKDGSVIYVLCYGRRYFDSATRSGRAEVIVADVADTYTLRIMADMERNKVRRQQAQWENAYRRDSLTGLLTRNAFKSDTEFKLLEGKCKVMLLMLDVDKFKEYNDTYGHVAGDEFLNLIGQTLLSSLRRDDIAGRMGGDEFAAALFFKKESSDEFMYERAQQIFDKINMTLKMAAKGTSLSMGAIISNEEMNTFNELYQSADRLLYKSKENGRSRLSVRQ
ncbi:PAS domain S-box-containing protein/diguanylate cyclase (GGDEF) domain-containing protein [Fibrobacter sp. UWH5]|uniref:diguanylate cyclase domain-containing protein n=1 Tax=Fibrobacter sp. UWH5 TaxID=1896211 RepID=UPI000916D172|nr:diguanylate cyclase [Fibrobacter sp. UWH5]SHL19229.1 PAS domain S-box-containing protein/diguanylate cyclase (GGDEF) domain-containing protein [Fibrobacter sp. UWH5]